MDFEMNRLNAPRLDRGGSGSGKSRKRGRSKPMPAEAWKLISSWLDQAERFEVTCNEGDRPDSNLVVAALQAGAIPGVLSPINLTDDKRVLRFSLAKPRGGDPSERSVDVESAVLIALLVILGGRLYLDPSGTSGLWFYGRLAIYGAGNARPYIMRILAETEQGYQTKEGPEFHSWCRRDLALRPPRGHDSIGLHGLEDAKSQAKNALSKAIQRSRTNLLEGLTEERFAALLELSHRLMKSIPLGTDRHDPSH